MSDPDPRQSKDALDILFRYFRDPRVTGNAQSIGETRELDELEKQCFLQLQKCENIKPNDQKAGGYPKNCIFIYSGKKAGGVPAHLDNWTRNIRDARIYPSKGSKVQGYVYYVSDSQLAVFDQKERRYTRVKKYISIKGEVKRVLAFVYI